MSRKLITKPESFKTAISFGMMFTVLTILLDKITFQKAAGLGIFVTGAILMLFDLWFGDKQ